MFTVRGTRLMLSPHTAFRVRLSSTSSAPPRRKSTSGSGFLPPASSSSSASKTSLTHTNFLERPTASDANMSFTAALSQMTRRSTVLADSIRYCDFSGGIVGLWCCVGYKDWSWGGRRLSIWFAHAIGSFHGYPEPHILDTWPHRDR
ncbi:hypothetical protein D9613_012781 [Agrocybe pediades]|uniref:Uncharacterized protein n=1 Tax=Agrocybe pediades TaxID=84607 RepID=A0A8H4R1J7_9AGAR|nr:hypothetical protein D9613_012781 [Agrocybe pediades]